MWGKFLMKETQPYAFVIVETNGFWRQITQAELVRATCNGKATKHRARMDGQQTIILK